MGGIVSCILKYSDTFRTLFEVICKYYYIKERIAVGNMELNVGNRRAEQTYNLDFRFKNRQKA